MAQSQRDRILAYIVAELDEIDGITAQRVRLAPVRREDGIVAIVSPVQEDVEHELQSTTLRRLTVQVAVVAVAEVDAIPDAYVDAVAVAVYAKLMANHSARTLGGLVGYPIVELNRGFQFEDSDGGGSVVHTLQFLVTYVTTLGDESTAG